MTSWHKRAVVGCACAFLSACSASSHVGEDRHQAAGGAGGIGAAGTAGSALVDAGDLGDASAWDDCTNVDILFVVDNSGSMADNQQSLINSFPGFVSAIQTQLKGALSYHVGIVTTDAYQHNEVGCRKSGNLVTQTGGPESSNAVCGPYSTGKRFMDEKETDLASKFACAAKVGSGGNDDERQARSLLDAIKPENNAAGTCNDGFSRLDSLLVVVLITDEDDWPDVCGDPNTMTPCGCETCGSGGEPQSWYDELVSYKAGIAQNIVVLSLLGEKYDNACGAMVCAKLIGFTNRFGSNGHTDDVCAASYDQFFADVLPIIDQACQSYIPPPK